MGEDRENPRKKRRRRKRRAVEDLAAEALAAEEAEAARATLEAEGPPPAEAEASAGADEPSVYDSNEAVHPRRLFCRACGVWRPTETCAVCGADLMRDGIVAYGDAVEAGGGVGVIPWLRVAVREVLPSLPGSLACWLLSAGALLSQTLLPGMQGVRWPGVIFASYACTFWLVERTRAARSNSADLDMEQLGPTLMRALVVFPLLAGLAMGEAAVAITVGVVLLPVMPLLLGALAAEDAREWTPRSLYAAYQATEAYFRYALCSTAAMACAVGALGWVEGSPGSRATVATLGITVAGTLAGLARRGAEHMEA